MAAAEDASANEEEEEDEAPGASAPTGKGAEEAAAPPMSDAERRESKVALAALLQAGEAALDGLRRLGGLQACSTNVLGHESKCACKWRKCTVPKEVMNHRWTEGTKHGSVLLNFLTSVCFFAKMGCCSSNLIVYSRYIHLHSAVQRPEAGARARWRRRRRGKGADAPAPVQDPAARMRSGRTVPAENLCGPSLRV